MMHQKGCHPWAQTIMTKSNIGAKSMHIHAIDLLFVRALGIEAAFLVPIRSYHMYLMPASRKPFRKVLYTPFYPTDMRPVVWRQLGYFKCLPGVHFDMTISICVCHCQKLVAPFKNILRQHLVAGQFSCY